MTLQEYVDSGQPYRTTDGKVFQKGSELSLHRGFWWWDIGCPVAPEGQEKYLPLIDTNKMILIERGTGKDIE